MMSFQEDDRELSFLKRIAPLFYNELYDPVQTEKNAQKFKNLIAAFDMMPGIKKSITQNCVNTFMDNSDMLDANDVFYYMCKYHTDQMIHYDGTGLGSNYSPDKIQLVNNVMDSYHTALPLLMDMSDIDLAFTTSDRFDPSRFDRKKMDMYRVEKIVMIETDLDCSRMIAPADFIQNLHDISRLGTSHTDFIQNKMTDIGNQLLDTFSACSHAAQYKKKTFSQEL